jgi:hypothetical protein
MWGDVTQDADLLITCDDDDPAAGQYGPGVRVMSGPRRLGPILNALAVAAAPRYEAVGTLGDDHRPRTPGWDRRLMTALAGRPGVAYGDDLFQGPLLPTAVVISSAVILALGYMVPPGVMHLYMDNFWLRLGHDLGVLEYCPDVIIEHVHPSAGKAEWDDGYARVNSAENAAADYTAWDDFLHGQWPGDLARLRETLGREAP